MKSTFKILFYAKTNKEKKDGKVPLMVRVTIDGEMIQFSTKTEITKSLWSGKEHKVIGRSQEAMTVNGILTNLTTVLTNKYHELSVYGERVTPEMLKAAYLGLDVRNDTLLKFFGAFNEKKEATIGYDIAQSTFNKYHLTYRRLESFMIEKMQIKDIRLKDINLDFVMGFDQYLRVDFQMQNNSVEKLVRIFKRIITICMKNGLIRKDPFGGFKIKKIKKRRIALTESELTQIMKHEFESEKLAKVKDLFVFACFTGLSYAELYNLTEDKLKTGFDGEPWIQVERKKTGIPTDIKLLDVPLRILKKYEDKRIGVKLLPIISNTNYNRYLKEIAEACGITKTITTHIARHTFATAVALANGVPMEIVSEVLGHTSLATTRIYAKVLKENVREAMSSLGQATGDLQQQYI